MSKNIKSVALSIAGIMIAAPAGAEIASTDYVDRVVGETHIQGSVLQFGKLTDDPAFILGATGTGVSNYGAVSIAELGLTLGSQIAGSAITGFATGSGSFVLVGDGTTTGSAMWQGVQNMLYGLPSRAVVNDGEAAVVEMLARVPSRANMVKWQPLMEVVQNLYGNDGWWVQSELATGANHVLVGGAIQGSLGVYGGNAKWSPLSGFGSSIAGYRTMAASGISHILVGSSATGAASWATVNDLVTKIQGARITGFLPYGQAASSGGLGTGATISASGGSYVLAGASGSDTDVAGWRNIADVLEAVPTGSGNLVLIRNSLDTAGDGDNIYWTGVTGISKMVRGSSITGYGTGTGAYVLVGDGTTTGSAKWRGMSTIGSGIAGYGAGTGSFVLVGDGTTTGSAKWSSVADMMLGLDSYGVDTTSLLMYVPGKDYFTWVPVGGDNSVASLFPGSKINGYGTGTGSYVLVGSTTTGVANYTGASNLSQYMQGSLISGYNTVTGQPSYILGSSASGTGAKPALYPMSGLGSKIEFTETKTAAQLSASTGTIYFPVIQGGKIYGVTLNDFYILMNAQF